MTASEPEDPIATAEFHAQGWPRLGLASATLTLLALVLPFSCAASIPEVPFLSSRLPFPVPAIVPTIVVLLLVLAYRVALHRSHRCTIDASGLSVSAGVLRERLVSRVDRASVTRVDVLDGDPRLPLEGRRPLLLDGMGAGALDALRRAWPDVPGPATEPTTPPTDGSRRRWIAFGVAACVLAVAVHLGEAACVRACEKYKTVEASLRAAVDAAEATVEKEIGATPSSSFTGSSSSMNTALPLYMSTELQRRCAAHTLGIDVVIRGEFTWVLGFGKTRFWIESRGARDGEHMLPALRHELSARGIVVEEPK